MVVLLEIFADAMNEYLDILENPDPYDRHDWNSHFLGDFNMNGLSSRDRDLKRILRDHTINSHVDKNDYENDEPLPSPIQDDGSTLLTFALVRPKKLRPEDYTYTQFETEFEEDCDDPDDVNHDYPFYTLEDYEAELMEKAQERVHAFAQGLVLGTVRCVSTRQHHQLLGTQRKSCRQWPQ